MKARFVTQVEGQRTGLQEIEDRIIVVAASSRAHAERQVRRVCAMDEGVILLTSGYFRRRVFEKVLEVWKSAKPQTVSLIPLEPRCTTNTESGAWLAGMRGCRRAPDWRRRTSSLTAGRSGRSAPRPAAEPER